MKVRDLSVPGRVRMTLRLHARGDGRGEGGVGREGQSSGKEARVSVNNSATPAQERANAPLPSSARTYVRACVPIACDLLAGGVALPAQFKFLSRGRGPWSNLSLPSINKSYPSASLRGWSFLACRPLA